jgi:hypothetical protein
MAFFTFKLRNFTLYTGSYNAQSILSCLLFAVSVNEDHQVQNGCKKMLLEILHYQLMDGQQKWAPRLVDILSVLHNYGIYSSSV